MPVLILSLSTTEVMGPEWSGSVCSSVGEIDDTLGSHSLLLTWVASRTLVG